MKIFSDKFEVVYNKYLELDICLPVTSVSIRMKPWGL